MRDLAVSADWYERLFDLDQVIDEPGEERRAKVYRLRGTTALLGLVQHAGSDGSVFDAGRTGLDHAAVEVTTLAAIEAWTGHLDEAGVQHSGVIFVPMGAILNFADPDGIRLSIFWDAGG